MSAQLIRHTGTALMEGCFAIVVEIAFRIVLAIFMTSLCPSCVHRDISQWNPKLQTASAVKVTRGP